MQCCGEKIPSLRCCGDLKLYGVRYMHFKVYGVWRKNIICGIPVSIISGQITYRRRSSTGEAAVTFRRIFAVIFIDLSDNFEIQRQSYHDFGLVMSLF